MYSLNLTTAHSSKNEDVGTGWQIEVQIEVGSTGFLEDNPPCATIQCPISKLETRDRHHRSNLACTRMSVH
jgi:hypothetical protein